MSLSCVVLALCVGCVVFLVDQLCFRFITQLFRLQASFASVMSEFEVVATSKGSDLMIFGGFSWTKKNRARMELLSGVAHVDRLPSVLLFCGRSRPTDCGSV